MRGMSILVADREFLYGSFLNEVERCRVKQIIGPLQCPEIASWTLEDENLKRKVVCDRCLIECIRRLTARGRRVIVSQISKRGQSVSRIVSPSAEGG